MMFTPGLCNNPLLWIRALGSNVLWWDLVGCTWLWWALVGSGGLGGLHLFWEKLEYWSDNFNHMALESMQNLV